MMLRYKFCNTLNLGCGIQGVRSLPDNSIHLVVTSPPYDGIREFGGHPFHFEAMAKELYRVLAPGGVVCWQIQDQIVDGSETGTSSEHKLYFRNLGFRLYHPLVIDSPHGSVNTQYRYGPSLQYVFLLSKGKPRVFTPSRLIPNKMAGKFSHFKLKRKDGTLRTARPVIIKEKRIAGPVWQIAAGATCSSDPETKEHPSAMNETLVRDLICSWSKPGDLVLDPMSGVGTTAKVALLSGRLYVGFEIYRKYHELAIRRLERAYSSLLISA